MDKNNKMQLHAVIVSKKIPFEDAQKISKEFIPKNRNFYRETKNSYRFRNHPKQQFDSFYTKKLNKDVSLIYGEHKTISGGGFWDSVSNWLIKNNPLSWMLKSSVESAQQNRLDKNR